MSKMTYQLLEDSMRTGGASALSESTELGMAGGPQALVAPAKYTSGKNSNEATYVFETRYVDGNSVHTVLIDSRTSEANRLEEAMIQATKEGQRTFSLMPHVRVMYHAGGTDERIKDDYQLPHRAFDAHIRLGFSDLVHSSSIIQDERYKAMRNASPADASGLFEWSPVTVLLGGWDSTRKTNQARFASCVTGEIIGVLSDQDSDPKDVVTHRSGARIDPFGAEFGTLDKVYEKELRQRAEMKETTSGKWSALTLGAIPPSAGQEALDGISVKKIIRSRELSFSALRSLDFGKGAQGNLAARCLLAALALDAMARADSELCLRANAHLIELDKPEILIHERYGKTEQVEPMTVEEADALLDEAYEKASEQGVRWEGKALEVYGDDKILDGIDDAADGE